jgi:hypothetical protein
MSRARATLTVSPRPDLGPGWREAVVDCEHATTRAAYLNPPSGAGGTSEAFIAAVAVGRHFGEERCSCTRALRKRFGMGRA